MSAKAKRPHTAARIVAIALLASATGCSVARPRDTYMTVRPKTEPSRTVTSFSGALACMDDMFLDHQAGPYQITSIGLPDATDRIETGAREMLITAISRMTRRSRAFQYTDWDLKRDELSFLNDNDPRRNAIVPTYYIRGAITQLDQRVVDWRKGGGLSADVDSVGSADASFDMNETAGVVAVDMNIGLVRTRRIMPGLSASNSLAVSRSGSGWDAGLAIEQIGAFFSLEMARQEGMHHAVRTLVELGLVELLGKLARVPYWECLQVHATNPKVIEEAADWYSDMSEDERTTFVQRMLIANGYMTGSATGAKDHRTRAAIAAYQSEHDMVPSGRVSFELYHGMLGQDRPAEAGAPTSIVEEEEPDFYAEQIAVREAVAVALTSVKGDEPVYEPLESVTATAAVSDDAYLYCYYRDGDGSISRIFPNRFDRGAFVAEDDQIHIPTPDAGFRIVVDNPAGEQELMCVGSDRELGMHLPPELMEADLEPLPVTSLDDLVARFEQIDGLIEGTGVSVARMPIRVKLN